jgi:hypothetical protein
MAAELRTIPWSVPIAATKHGGSNNFAFRIVTDFFRLDLVGGRYE